MNVGVLCFRFIDDNNDAISEDFFLYTFYNTYATYILKNVTKRSINSDCEILINNLHPAITFSSCMLV